MPYLNGGLFDVHHLEKHNTIDIKDEAFEQLFDFFDGWQWTLDIRPDAPGDEINPDVIGYIFEQYINERAEMGAYSTPRRTSPTTSAATPSSPGSSTRRKRRTRRPSSPKAACGRCCRTPTITSTRAFRRASRQLCARRWMPRTCLAVVEEQPFRRPARRGAQGPEPRPRGPVEDFARRGTARRPKRSRCPPRSTANSSTAAAATWRCAAS